MLNIERRLEMLERTLRDVDCICATRRGSVIVVQDDETRELALARMSFQCQTHGECQPSRPIFLSTVDAAL